jgi:hypothetical protein
MTSVPVPAAIPSEEEIARVLFDPENPQGEAFAQQSTQTRARYLKHARNVLGLFAPILAEKERKIERQRDRGDGYKRAFEASEAALAGERERCALIAANETIHPLGEQIAAAIRAQGPDSTIPPRS